MEPKGSNYFESLSLQELRKKIKDIKTESPHKKRNIITYSRNFTLSLSNYCRNNCKYCYYNHRIPKAKKNDNTILLRQERIAEFIKRAKELNCKEALIMSGEQPDTFPEVKKALEQLGYQSFLEYVKEICKSALDSTLLPHVNIGILSYNELKQLKQFNASMGLMLESTCDELSKEGEVHEHSPGKKPEIRIQHLTNAGKLQIPFTTGLLVGIGESFQDRINDLYLIKELHKSYGHIQEVIIQNFEYKQGVAFHPQKKVLMKDILKITGIAKIIFRNEIAVQVPPNLIQGYESEFLAMGIDDFGGISPFTQDYINPEKKWPRIERLEHICEKKGFILKERLPIYDKYLNKAGFCSEKIRKVIETIKI
jgi:7,8-didemethyl-8-hydroxy-5-deazariboflavin synthase CofG subunit